MKKYTAVFFACFCLIIACATLAGAAPVSVYASVNKTALTLDDELTLTVTVDGAAGNVMPQLPSLPAFNVYSRSTSTQVFNGHATTIFDYTMMPRFPGKTTIGPVSATYAGQTYQTTPIDITVYRTPTQDPPLPVPAAQTAYPAANAQAQPVAKPAVQQAPASLPMLERTLYNQAAKKGGQDYFMVAAVSDKNPYANQTFTLAVRFYYDKPTSGSAPYSAPAITNLFLEEVGRNEGQQVIGNLTYHYVEMRYAAVGVTEGKAEIGPAKITYVPMSRRNLSFFGVFTASMEDPRTVQSNPITLQIRPVPTQDQPSTFYGAVGSGYTLVSSVDRNEVEAGDAVNLTVQVSGPGNLKATRDLKLPKLPNFKTYDVVASGGAVADNGMLKSYKVFKTVLVPVSSGQYTIPPLFWSYYDPSLEQYRTLRTEPITLQVTPASKTDTGFDFRAHTDLNGGIQTLGQDIRYLKNPPAPQPTDWLAQLAERDDVSVAALVLLFLAALMGWKANKISAARSASSKARAHLKKAKTEQDIADALSLYLQIKYGIHTASLPLRQIQDELKARSCPEPLINHFTDLWQQLEAARFAPAALQHEGFAALVGQAEQFIRQMDKGVRA